MFPGSTWILDAKETVLIYETECFSRLTSGCFVVGRPSVHLLQRGSIGFYPYSYQ